MNEILTKIEELTLRIIRLTTKVDALLSRGQV